MNSKTLRSYLLAGLIVWLPVLITFVVIRFIVDLLDSTMALLPKAYQPEQLFGIYIPGLGVIISLALLLITGLIAKNFLGERLVSFGESLLTRIPLVRSVYNASKQVIETIFASNSQAFRKVVLVEYPRKGLWTVAFLTGSNQLNESFFAAPEHAKKFVLQDPDKALLSVFVPTTPNPTSGFLLMVPKEETIELAMSVDEALKFIISLGVMNPVVTLLPQSSRS